MMFASALDAALSYRSRGWSVIPIAPGSKKPALTWEEFQRRIATEDEIRAWYRRYPRAGVAIVTGRVSGILALDCDGEVATRNLSDHWGVTQFPITPRQRTRNGEHHLFRHPATFAIPSAAHPADSKNTNPLLAGIDWRGDGGYILAAPTLHPDGGVYGWTESPQAELADTPRWFYRLIAEHRRDSVRPPDVQPLRLPSSPPLVDAASAGAQALQPRMDRPGANNDIDIPLADVKAEKVWWLWAGRIARGKLTILEGPPGLGKSLLTMTVAAAQSKGRALPGGPELAPANVLLVSFEDGPGDTIRPRAEAAGADLERVRVWALGTRWFTMPHDVDALRERIRERDYALVVIDPLSAALAGAIDSHKDQHVRRALAPFAVLAEETGVAIVFIRHLTKHSPRQAINAGGASIGIGGAARSVLLFDKDPEDPDRRILASVKCNIAVAPPSLALHIGSKEVPVAGPQPIIEFDGEVQITADDLAAARAEAAADGSEEAPAAVEASLRAWLAHGPLPFKEMEGLARAEGISARTLRRHARRIGVEFRPQGFGKERRTDWCLGVPAIAATFARGDPNGRNGRNGPSPVHTGQRSGELPHAAPSRQPPARSPGLFGSEAGSEGSPHHAPQQPREDWDVENL